MKNLIITLTSTTLFTLSALTHAGMDRDQHFTRDYACKVLESTSKQIETELRSNLNIGMPQLRVEEAGEFGIGHSTAQVGTQASNSSPASVRKTGG